MDKMREEFELMCKEIGVPTTRITVVGGGLYTTGYQIDEVNEMFGVFCFAWKASRAALCVELPESCKGKALTVNELHKQLDKAGVSYK